MRKDGRRPLVQFFVPVGRVENQVAQRLVADCFPLGRNNPQTVARTFLSWLTNIGDSARVKFASVSAYWAPATLRATTAMALELADTITPSLGGLPFLTT